MSSAQPAGRDARRRRLQGHGRRPQRVAIAVACAGGLALLLWLARPPPSVAPLESPTGPATLRQRAERLQLALERTTAATRTRPGQEKTTWDFEWKSPPTPGPMPKSGVDFDWPAPLTATVHMETTRNGDSCRAHWTIAFTRVDEEFRLASSNFEFDGLGELGRADAELAKLFRLVEFVHPTLTIDDDGRATDVVDLDAAFESVAQATRDDLKRLESEVIGKAPPILGTIRSRLDDALLNLRLADCREFAEESARKEWRWWVESVVRCDLVPGAEDTKVVDLELVPGTRVEAEVHRRNEGPADSPKGAIQIRGRVELSGPTLRPIAHRLPLVLAPDVRFTDDELEATSKSLEQSGLEILFDSVVDPAHALPYHVVVEQRWGTAETK
jgi:hypothetical protein